jgi:unsaturated rhamnogalacturonyl hydrolase
MKFDYITKLTEKFGIHLNGNSKNKVYNDIYKMATFFIPENDSMFLIAHKVYLKEVSTLQLTKNAVPILKHQKENYVVVAKARYGKGTVIVMGGP